MNRSPEHSESFDYIRHATEARMLEINSVFMERANISTEQLGFVLPGEAIAEDNSFFILQAGYTEPGLSVGMRQYSTVETVADHPDDFKFELFGLTQVKSALPLGELAVVSYLNTVEGFDGGEPLDTVGTNVSETELKQMVKVVESPELRIVRLSENPTHSRTMISQMGDEMLAEHAIFLDAAGDGSEAVAFANRTFCDPAVMQAARTAEDMPSIRRWLSEKFHRA